MYFAKKMYLTLSTLVISTQLSTLAFAESHEVLNCQKAGVRNFTSAELTTLSNPVNLTVREILESCPQASEFLKLVIQSGNEGLLDKPSLFAAIPTNEAILRFMRLPQEGYPAIDPFIVDQFVKRQFANFGSDEAPWMSKVYPSYQSPTNFLKNCGSTGLYGSRVCDGNLVTTPLGGSSDYNNPNTILPKPIYTVGGSYVDIVNGFHLLRRTN